MANYSLFGSVIHSNSLYRLMKMKSNNNDSDFNAWQSFFNSVLSVKMVSPLLFCHCLLLWLSYTRIYNFFVISVIAPRCCYLLPIKYILWSGFLDTLVSKMEENLCAILIQSLFINAFKCKVFCTPISQQYVSFRNQHSIMLYLFYKYENNQIKWAYIAKLENKPIACHQNHHKWIIVRVISFIVRGLKIRFSRCINKNCNSLHISISRISFVYHFLFFFLFHIIWI